MSNPARKLFVRAIHKFHSQTFYTLPSRISSSSSSSSSSIAHLINPTRTFSSTSSSAAPPSDLSAPCQLWRRLSSRGIISKPSTNASGMNSSSLLGPNLQMSRDAGGFGVGVKGLGIRFFSSGKGLVSVKSIAAKPMAAVGSVVEKYRKAAGLHVEAFWKRNYLLLVGAVGVGVCILLWRIMFGIASTFVGLSEGMAKYGFLALAAAMVSFAGLFIRSRFTINPDKIYRIAMRRLNTSAGMLEVMGAPLAGTDVRAYIMSGGGPKIKNFKLKLGGKRCFLIFPIRGSERRGLVSVEAKKKKGQYDIKLLAVDVPMATGPDQRIFLVGDEKEYSVGGGLIFELRDPIVKAMAAEKEFDELDQKEDEEDLKNEVREAERKQQEEELKILDNEKKSQ